jgi:hypothetical protein
MTGKIGLGEASNFFLEQRVDEQYVNKKCPTNYPNAYKLNVRWKSVTEAVELGSLVHSAVERLKNGADTFCDDFLVRTTRERQSGITAPANIF